MFVKLYDFIVLASGVESFLQEKVMINTSAIVKKNVLFFIKMRINC